MITAFSDISWVCFCSFWISLFSFLSASLFGFCLGCLLSSLRLYSFIFFLTSSDIQGRLLSYLIVLVGISFEIDICKLSWNVFHILSISCESCDWFILLYVVFISCFILSQLTFEYFSICLGLFLRRRRETVISRDNML